MLGCVNREPGLITGNALRMPVPVTAETLPIARIAVKRYVALSTQERERGSHGSRALTRLFALANQHDRSP